MNQITRKEYEEFRYSYEHEQMSGGAFILVANNYIFNLEATIEAQNIIIKDKSAFMEAMTEAKRCFDCADKYDCHSYKTLEEHQTFIMSCPYYEPKEQP